MDALVKDVRFAFRTLLKSPAFTLIALVTIGLGIGANTAIFSVVRAVLLRPLPYEEPDELYMVWSRMTNRNVDDFPFSPPVLREMRERSEAFTDLAGVLSFQGSLTGGDGDPEQISVAGATPNLMDVLGVNPLLGRNFRPEDAVFTEPAPGGGAFGLPQATLLSWELWQRRFGGDPEIVGRTVEIGGTPIEVVGVMPRGFELLLPPETGVASEVDAWMAPAIDMENWPWANVIYRVVGRRAPGATATEMQAEMDRFAGFVREQVPVFNTSGFEIEVVPMRADLTEAVRPVMLALLGAVGFVLLIACANVSNLLLVRAAAREREIAVRAALGGSRGRILRGLLVESVMLSLAGGLLGLALAQGGIELLLSLRPADVPRIGDVSIDLAVLGFTLLAAMAAAVLFGIVPALKASRPELVASLKERGGGSGVERQRAFRNGLVVGEVALSVVLLVGAGLLIRSFVALQRVEPGFEPENVLTFNLPVPFARYPTSEDRSTFNLRMKERLEALPGVRSVGAGFPVPLATKAPFSGRYGTEEALADESFFRQANYRAVLPGYFETLGTRLLAGRTFTTADVVDSAAVVVVDERLAERTWPGQPAVGERFLVRLTSTEPEWVEVIGVVEHQRSTDLARDGRETVYFNDRFAGGFANFTWVVKSQLPPEGLVRQVRAAVAELDPSVPVADVSTMEAHVDEAMAETRFALVLIGVFGVLALALAAVGLYGVLAYVVRQRTREIGVRVAFGAERGDILRLVVGQGMLLTLGGLAVGLVAAFWLTRFMAGLLVDVAPTDPITFVGTAVVFAGVSALAAGLPALAATRVDPAVALREE